MRSNKRVLVVGTTSDYIDWIERHYPESALFLTAPDVRSAASEPAPPPATEIVCLLSDYRQPRAELATHLAVHRIQLDGVVSFDCESMGLAADLAARYHLPYPSLQAVDNCRNKYAAKSLWQAAGLDTPAARLVHTADEAAAFIGESGGRCVLKPLSGSGSELIFSCTDEAAGRKNFIKIRQGLQQRADHRLYQPFLNAAPDVLAEEWIQGEEYSCDFIIDAGRADIIRLTRKIPAGGGHFGITRGYLLAPALFNEIDISPLEDTLVRSAGALGLTRAICMLDFMIVKGRIILLELAPRPGGDCLPPLLRAGLGIDIIKLAMDFSRRVPVRVPALSDFPALAGVRLMATTGGRLKEIDVQSLRQDDRVREIGITRKPGHLIQMPPADYDSWILGHIIFSPDGLSGLDEQCRQLLNQVIVKVE